jgi:hypothetical protein
MKRPFSIINYSMAVLLLLLCIPFVAGSQQQEADDEFTPVIDNPLYQSGKGPLILVDGGHHNFHTLDDKFAPFAKVAEIDGFRVRNIPGKIDVGLLKQAGILVIANALNEKNEEEWKLPIYPAFTPEEIKEISNWVRSGGSLFLIADHMPFPEAVADLASVMGFTMHNGFALRGPNRKFDVFSYGNGMLQHNHITDMHSPIDSIVSFTGQAFAIPDSATSILTFDSTYKVLMPDEAWKFSRQTKMIPAGGLSQLAYARYGSGRVVVAGEAAMFTAQKVGEIKFGLNAPFARNNTRLLRNLMEWLVE